MDITHDQVLVLPAPGLPGRLPFWKGDTLGRPAELGRAHGEFVREIVVDARASGRQRLTAAGLDEYARRNLVDYLAEQRDATGLVPDEKTLVVERFRDELGDWRIVLHSPYGAAVHAPWALVISARMRERYGVDVAAMHADDGIVLRLPDVEYERRPAGFHRVRGARPADARGRGDRRDRRRGRSSRPGSGSARPGRCCCRAGRSASGSRCGSSGSGRRQLLEVASAYPSFPIVAEAVRECLSDVFDVPALVA